MTINGSALTTGSDTAGSLQYVTASVAPAADRTLFLAASTTRGATGDYGVSSVVGLGLTWTLVGGGSTELVDGTRRRLSMWRADTGGSAPTPGTIALNCNLSPNSAQWAVLEVSGADNDAPVVQFKEATASAAETITATFDSAPDAGNGIIAATVTFLQDAISPGSGYTELTDVNINAPSGTMETEWRADGVTTASATWTGASSAMMIAVEVASAGAVVAGQGSASLGGTFTAAGVDRALGAAVASLGGTFTAAGQPRTPGQGTAALGFTGTAAGRRRHPGLAQAALGGTFTAAGLDRALGQAAAALGGTFAASGIAGSAPVEGQGTAGLGGTFTASGVDRALGQGTASLGGAFAAAGQLAKLGQADASLGGTFTALGTDRALGVATASLGGTFTAEGRSRLALGLTSGRARGNTYTSGPGRDDGPTFTGGHSRPGSLTGG